MGGSGGRGQGQKMAKLSNSGGRVPVPTLVEITLVGGLVAIFYFPHILGC